MSGSRPPSTPPVQPTRIHASCVLVGRKAVLLRGASGSGKSEIVLQLLENAAPDRGVRLVADDAVELVASGGRLVASAPAATHGVIEVRGVGLVNVPSETRAVIGLVVDLVSDRDPQRLPEAEDGRAELLGVVVPRLILPAGVSGNLTRILIGLAALDAGGNLPIISGLAPG